MSNVVPFRSRPVLTIDCSKIDDQDHPRFDELLFYVSRREIGSAKDEVFWSGFDFFSAHTAALVEQKLADDNALIRILCHEYFQDDDDEPEDDPDGGETLDHMRASA